MTVGAAARADARTQALLHGPLVPTLVRLAAPNVLGLVAMTVTIAYGGWVVGRLGPDALAGVALVFASQGAGRLFWPLVGSVARLAVVLLGGLAVLHWAPGQPQALFAVVAAGFVAYAGIIAAAIALGRWTNA